ncbi:murein hydrolase activator EnvC [Edwardsiella tarda]
MRGNDLFCITRLDVVPSVGNDTCATTLAAQVRCRLSRLSMVCAGVLFAGSTLFPTAALAADSNKQQLQSIRQDIAAKEKSVKQQQQQRAALQDQLKAQEKQIAQAGRALHDTQAELSKLDQRITALNASIRKLQSKENGQSELLARQLDIAFRLGKHTGMQVLLNGEESQRSERLLAYFGYLNTARQQNIAALQETRTDLSQQKRELESAKIKQKAVLTTQQEAQQLLQQARASRQKTLSALESSLAKDQQQLDELRQNEARLRDKIARAEREARARAEREAREAARVRAEMKAKEAQAKKKGTTYKPSESERALLARTGGLGRPAGQAIWPVRGRVIHGFGEPLQGELRWKGMVIAAPEGSEVHAIADGRVLLADWLQGYGLVVVIEHGKGDMSLYGYNQSALVNVGAQVKAGQPIALVGDSGGQGQSALYFEIRRQGQAVNPRPWLGR